MQNRGLFTLLFFISFDVCYATTISSVCQTDRGFAALSLKKIPKEQTSIDRWAAHTKVARNLIRLTEKPPKKVERAPRQRESVFYIPSTEPATMERYHKEVVPNTVGFIMTKDWYPNGEAPFHAYMRIGDRVFRFPAEGKVLENSYKEILQELKTRTGTQPETREMVFTVSDQAQKALLEYFEGRLNSKLHGEPIQAHYDVGAVGPDSYDEHGVKQEMCVTFALSCIEPRFVKMIPGLAEFQEQSGMYSPTPDATAKQILGHLTFSAKPDAVVMWSSTAYNNVKRASHDPDALKEIYSNFFATIGGKRLEIEVVPE